MFNHGGHEEAVALQREKSALFLEEYHHEHQERGLPLTDILIKNNLIFESLRSKIFPETNLLLFSKDVYDSYVANQDPMTFTFVLASSTANKELASVLKFLEIFSTFPLKPKAYFLLIDWPRFHDDKTPQSTVNSYQEISNRVGAFFHLCHNSPQIDVIEAPQITAFMKSHEELLKEKDFQTDLAWIERFYEREHSYYRLSPEQAYLDLIVRRFIAFYANEMIFSQHARSEKNYLITTELHKRLLKCYRAGCTILNISLEAQNA
ncbi:MAG: hypothetical protein H2057_04415 [Alphaproteobacteria bacterium]|nr:hypothetical protein [Alphaproteobacteria bacterium]